MADVGNVCVSVKSSAFSCRRDALEVNKKDRMKKKKTGMLRRQNKSCGDEILSILVLSFEK